MIAGFNRVVTAVDEKGKAVVCEETPVEPVEVAMLPGIAFYPVWGYDVLPKVPVERPSAVYEPIFPAGGAEPDEAALGALLAECEEKLPGLIGVLEPDGSGMHTTPTVDYDVVLAGELYLQLDDGAEVRVPAGTCIVQNGTRHAWQNRGDVPAFLAYVCLGAPS